jgi:hypothetical protein
MKYSPLIVESAAVVLVKEERRPKAISAAVTPPIFLQRWPTPSLLGVVDIHLCPSRK